MATPKEHLLFPIQSSVLSALGVYAVLSGIASIAFWLAQFSGMGGLLPGVLGLFLQFAAIVSLIGFSFVIFRGSANGRAKVPPITIEEFRSLWSRPFMALVALLIVTGFSLTRIGAVIGSPGTELLTLCALLLLPAALSLMLLNDSLLQALSPVHQVKMVAALRWPYLILPASLAVAAFVVVFILRQEWPWPFASLTWGYVVMLAVHICGATLYRFHERIGFDPFNETLTRDAFLAHKHERDFEQKMDVAFMHARTDSQRAMAVISELFVNEHDTLEEREAVLERVVKWPNSMVAMRLSQDVIARQLGTGDNTGALQTASESLQRNAAFRPTGADATLRLATLAKNGGRLRIVTALLSDFGTRFPEHPQRGAASLLCARLALEKTGEFTLARAKLQTLEKSEHLRNDPRVAALREALATAP